MKAEEGSEGMKAEKGAREGMDAEEGCEGIDAYFCSPGEVRAGEDRAGQLRCDPRLEDVRDEGIEEAREPDVEGSREVRFDPLQLPPPTTTALRNSHTLICAGRMAGFERTCCSSLSCSSRKAAKGPAGVVVVREEVAR